MYQLIRNHQLNIMLFLCGACAVIAFFVLVTGSMSRRRRASLFLVEFGATMLLTFDRFAYLFRGDVSNLGYWMVRISNFLVFFLTLATLMAFNFYMGDLLTHEGQVESLPKRLTACNIILILGMAMVVISQFTGFYYTFDATNHYERGPGFIYCHVFPILVILIQLTVTVQYGKKLNPGIWTSILLFSIFPMVASIAQVFLYGISLTNMTIVAMGVLLYVFSLLDINQTVKKAHAQEVESLKERQQSMSRLFEQTATALAEAIDAGKTHTQGHSSRVAQYSREIARLSGKSEESCEKVYFSALLHDVGMIGIPDAVLDKKGELSEEEQKIYEEHTVDGEKILSGIREYEYISVGAHYHHENYDGSGYPDHLKGTEIPEIARIIAVADEYDTMTSGGAYKSPLPQARVREEFVKEAGLRYDPVYARAMVQMIDNDPGYQMCYTGENKEAEIRRELSCEAYRSDISNGFPITEKVCRLFFKYEPTKKEGEEYCIPSIILFDSLDGRVHTTEQMIRDNNYTEFGEVWLDGHFICTRARNMEVTQADKTAGNRVVRAVRLLQGVTYEVEAGKFGDHVRLKISGGNEQIQVIAALPDTNRYTYMALTGENCHITDIDLQETVQILKEGDIPRIAEEITYLERLESDIKNVQIDGKRAAYTDAVTLRDGMRLFFHTMSLPTANLVWHCPYIVLFQGQEKKVEGEGYRELVLIRLDGEIEETEDFTDNRMLVTKDASFESWDTWKQKNRKGMECMVEFRRKGNKIIVSTTNAGVTIKNTTTLDKNGGEVYVSLTGDRCALTDIRLI
ncbi:MAG: HD domain-containing protein [Lachnospiraceae bacterium]|nr:HD domain-containing protein [Lachnospiraceae bacterium]